MSEEKTALDRALTVAGGNAADGRAVDALLNAELRLLLEAPPEETRIRPRILLLEAGPTALAFDTDARLAAFTEKADYVALRGRVLAELLAAQGLNLAVNPGVAASEVFHDAGALAWMAQVSAAKAETSHARIETLGPPASASEALVTALAARLADLAPLLADAWLVEAGHADGATRLLLALREAESAHMTGKRALDAAAEARRRALALAVSSSARLAQPEGPELDAIFVAEGDPALAAARRFGLGFDLPAPPAPEAATPDAPGMDPDRPPILR
ncbi:MAG: SseB family protein [Pseudomonadota bacterium]